MELRGNTREQATQTRITWIADKKKYLDVSPITIQHFCGHIIMTSDETYASPIMIKIVLIKSAVLFVTKFIHYTISSKHSYKQEQLTSDKSTGKTGSFRQRVESSSSNLGRVREKLLDFLQRRESKDEVIQKGIIKVKK